MYYNQHYNEDRRGRLDNNHNKIDEQIQKLRISKYEMESMLQDLDTSQDVSYYDDESDYYHNNTSHRPTSTMDYPHSRHQRRKSILKNSNSYRNENEFLDYNSDNYSYRPNSTIMNRRASRSRSNSLSESQI
jgi:hypothetical protein